MAAPPSASPASKGQISSSWTSISLPMSPIGGGVGWDGFLIMDWIHRMDVGKAMPVIIITGSDPAKYQARALAAGAISFFHKPFKPEEVIAAIAQTLGEVAAPASPSA